MDKWGARGISNNTGIPWTLEFIEKYKTKLRLNMNDLIENQGVWKKAFEPLLNDKVLMKLLKELYP